MADIVVGPTRVVPVQGDAIVVQLQPVPGVSNEVMLHITRNGRAEPRFTYAELASVLANLSTLAAALRGRPQPQAKP